MPDRTVQTEEEVAQTIAAIDKKEAEQAKEPKSQELPAEHPAVSMSSNSDGACPFMPGGFRSE